MRPTTEHNSPVVRTTLQNETKATLIPHTTQNTEREHSHTVPCALRTTTGCDFPKRALQTRPVRDIWCLHEPLSLAKLCHTRRLCRRRPLACLSLLLHGGSAPFGEDRGLYVTRHDERKQWQHVSRVHPQDNTDPAALTPRPNTAHLFLRKASAQQLRHGSGHVGCSISFHLQLHNTFRPATCTCIVTITRQYAQSENVVCANHTSRPSALQRLPTILRLRPTSYSRFLLFFVLMLPAASSELLCH